MTCTQHRTQPTPRLLPRWLARAYLHFLRFRTVLMLERVDEDTHELHWMRNVEAVKLMRHLAGEKQELLQQLQAISEELDAPDFSTKPIARKETP